jgi:membrane-associated phospholipid phosphatase
VGAGCVVQRQMKRGAARLSIGAVVSAAAVGLVAPAQADGIKTAGEVLRIALPAGAGGISVAKGDYHGVLQLALSEAASYGASYALQSMVKERTPDGTSNRSFPSDSAAVAFSAATYLERRYGWDYGMPAYAVAAFVGYSRVEADKHHWKDVAAGALIGWGASMLITSRYAEDVQMTLSSGYGDTPLGAQFHMIW